MPLRGRGAMMFWHDISDGDEDYNHWHAFEHMPERVGIAGFHRGRRYLATEGGPAYFNMYETESPATLTSEAYLERLNNPTPWSKISLSKFQNSNRSLCRVSASAGKGVGGVLMSLQFSPTQGREAELRKSLSLNVADLATRSCIVGAHLLEADEESSKLETAEKSLRNAPDEIADWVLLVEALNQPPLQNLRARDLSDLALEDMGIGEIQNVAFYRLCHLLAEGDLS